MAHRKCIAPGCTKNAITAKDHLPRCFMHLSYEPGGIFSGETESVNQGGDNVGKKKAKKIGKGCQVPGCENKVQARGLCWKHSIDAKIREKYALPSKRDVKKKVAPQKKVVKKKMKRSKASRLLDYDEMSRKHLGIDQPDHVFDTEVAGPSPASVTDGVTAVKCQINQLREDVTCQLDTLMRMLG